MNGRGLGYRDTGIKAFQFNHEPFVLFFGDIMEERYQKKELIPAFMGAARLPLIRVQLGIIAVAFQYCRNHDLEHARIKTRHLK